MWFTDRECRKNELYYFLLATVMFVSNSTMLLRQLFAVQELDTLGLLASTFFGIGIPFIVGSFIVKAYTDGCFGINEWWLLITVAYYPIVLIINEMTHEITYPMAMFPFMILYPALTVRAEGRRVAEISAIIGFTLAVLGLISYYIAVSGDWWHNRVLFYGDWWHRVFQGTIGELITGTTVCIIIAILPIKLGDYALPGYWVFKYRDTAIIALIALAIAVYLLTYGGVAIEIANVTYRGWGYI